ncbi:MAG: hypothetical protein HWE13_12090 [Gammaproteobacteria bacterium]|nr:hypothetical protein [Gammaproteobacteria bacterium]
MNKVWFFLMMFLLSSCSTKKEFEEKSVDEIIKNIEQSISCYSIWLDIYDNWEVEGGGLKASLLATREQILNDKKTLFSAIVRNNWLQQEARDFYVNDSSFGHFSYSSEQFREATFPELKVFHDQLPEGCRTYNMLTEVLWKKITELSKDRKDLFKFDEISEDLRWESPIVQNWTTFWLLVNIKSGE